MEIKVECSCGTHYKFDIEPVDGRMPAQVFCPDCGADGTLAANQVIAESSASMATPVQPALRMAEAAANPAAASLPATPPPVFRPQPAMPARPVGKALLDDPEPNTSMALVGAVGAGLVGMFVWYGIAMATGYELGIVAWGIGALVGVGTRLLGKVQTQAFGIIAGACALVAILGGQYLSVSQTFKTEMEKGMKAAYENQLKYAREVAQTQNDQELKVVMAKYDEDYENGQVSDKDLAAFKANSLPRMKDLASGKVTRAEYEKQFRSIMNAVVSPWELMKASLSLFTLLWLFLGVGSAYRIAGRS